MMLRAAKLQTIVPILLFISQVCLLCFMLSASARLPPFFLESETHGHFEYLDVSTISDKPLVKMSKAVKVMKSHTIHIGEFITAPHGLELAPVSKKTQKRSVEKDHLLMIVGIILPWAEDSYPVVMVVIEQTPGECLYACYLKLRVNSLICLIFLIVFVFRGAVPIVSSFLRRDSPRLLYCDGDQAPSGRLHNRGASPCCWGLEGFDTSIEPKPRSKV